jgi:long-subunit acyl-CoA synthetase (AMP-forming)/acyl carrier protein
MVGLYAANSPDWLAVFWAILAAGYRPLLMNTRLPHAVLEDLLATHGVPAVISDGELFSAKTCLLSDVTVASEQTVEARPFGTEVIFMSSGTTDNVKLCAYTGENFYYQICDSVHIVEECPEIARHYEGQIKQLALLPFYHVFGFIAVYLWFGFFSRTFVFPKDLNPITIQNTVKKHKVTHIFAVPMVWEAVHRAAIRKIRSRGERTLAKFERVLRAVNRLGALGNVLAKHLLREVRDGLFGESVLFMITGGSHIDASTLAFFNGIGYHIANGYGMTEIGITSLEKSKDRRVRNSCSVGAPFGYTQYKLDEQGTLLVRGRARAARILQGADEYLTDYDRWFVTNDLAECRDGHYHLCGRADDLIVCESGENLNPVLAESQIKVSGVEQLCICADRDGTPMLVVNVAGCFSGVRLKQIYEEIKQALEAARLHTVIRRVAFTHASLLEGADIKISRSKVAARGASGALALFDPSRIEEHMQTLLGGLEGEVCACFAEALGKDGAAIGPNDHFFHDLGGSSIDYFALAGMIKHRFGVDILSDEGERLVTVRDICRRIEQGE